MSGLQIHCDYDQGSGKWLAARCGMLCSSEFDRILTPTLKIADNPKSRAHCWELAAQRISRYVEPQYISDAMLRGLDDEVKARELYSKHYAEVDVCGFVTNDKWGFMLGCSPDGLVGKDGLIEVKSRGQRFQVQTIVEHYEEGAIPEDYQLQIQGQLLITERQWCDLVSYSGGLPAITMRVFPNATVQAAILDAAAKFEARINEIVSTYETATKKMKSLIPTERTIEQEMYIG